jgi:hypothetical protein
LKLGAYLTPDPSPAGAQYIDKLIIGWRGEYREEGAKPPLNISPPLLLRRQIIIQGV